MIFCLRYLPAQGFYREGIILSWFFWGWAPLIHMAAVSENPWQCKACGSVDIELHFREYKETSSTKNSSDIDEWEEIWKTAGDKSPEEKRHPHQDDN